MLKCSLFIHTPAWKGAGVKGRADGLLCCILTSHMDAGVGAGGGGGIPGKPGASW